MLHAIRDARKPSETTEGAAGARPRRRGWKAVAVLLALVLLDYLLYPVAAGVRAPSGNTGENGLWLRYHWYFGRKTDAEIAALADRLPSQQIRYAYFHVRHITRDGSLRYRYSEAASRLNRLLNQRAPGVRRIAWVFAGNVHRAPGLAEVDLADPGVRGRMVGEARWLVERCGFDGVQWDYEICEDGDPHFLSLLEETRDALPRRSLLSVATALWLPEPLPRRWGWSERYFRQVAGRCDQLAVMGYDTALYLPRAYVGLIRRQVVHVTRAVADSNPHCRVLVGVPTYARGGLSHHAHAENLSLALKGVREGLVGRGARPEVFAGIAPFADYTTQPEEWRVFRRLWLGKVGFTTETQRHGD